VNSVENTPYTTTKTIHTQKNKKKKKNKKNTATNANKLKIQDKKAKKRNITSAIALATLDLANEMQNHGQDQSYSPASG